MRTHWSYDYAPDLVLSIRLCTGLVQDHFEVSVYRRRIDADTTELTRLAGPEEARNFGTAQDLGAQMVSAVQGHKEAAE